MWSYYERVLECFNELVSFGLERKYPIQDLRVTLMVAKAEEVLRWAEDNPQVHAYLFDNQNKAVDYDEVKAVVKSIRERLRDWMILANFSRKEDL